MKLSVDPVYNNVGDFICPCNLSSSQDTQLGKITAIMESINLEPDSPCSVKTKTRHFNVMFELLKQNLGGIKL